MKRVSHRRLRRRYPSRRASMSPVMDSESVRVLLNASTSGDQEETHFILQDEATDQILLDIAILSSRVSADDWVWLKFEPDWQSRGKNLSSQDPGYQRLE